MSSQLGPNPAKYLFPGYLHYFIDISPQVYIKFVTDHPDVIMKGGVTGFVTEKVTIHAGQGTMLVEKQVLVLDISPHAISSWTENEEGVGFRCRFSGEVCSIFIPWEAMILIFIPSTTYGFQLVYRAPETPTDEEPQAKAPVNYLRRVK